MSSQPKTRNTRELFCRHIEKIFPALLYSTSKWGNQRRLESSS
jgi:hypothetical protein